VDDQLRFNQWDMQGVSQVKAIVFQLVRSFLRRTLTEQYIQLLIRFQSVAF
jgi:hypothetical protein